jgi:hypothetical protein
MTWLEVLNAAGNLSSILGLLLAVAVLIKEWKKL